MSIGLWNKDDSAHARIDELEKQIADIRGYELSQTLKIDSQSVSESIGSVVEQAVKEWCVNGLPAAKTK